MAMQRTGVTGTGTGTQTVTETAAAGERATGVAVLQIIRKFTWPTRCPVWRHLEADSAIPDQLCRLPLI